MKKQNKINPVGPEILEKSSSLGYINQQMLFPPPSPLQRKKGVECQVQVTYKGPEPCKPIGLEQMPPPCSLLLIHSWEFVLFLKPSIKVA